MAAFGSHWFCSLQLSGAFSTRISTAALTAQNELRETFPVKLESLCSCMVPAARPEWWLQPAWRNISKFKNWTWRLSLNFDMIISLDHTDGREPDPWANSCWGSCDRHCVPQQCFAMGLAQNTLCRTQPSALPSSKKPLCWSRTGLATLSSQTLADFSIVQGQAALCSICETCSALQLLSLTLNRLNLLVM